MKVRDNGILHRVKVRPYYLSGALRACLGIQMTAGILYVSSDYGPGL